MTTAVRLGVYLRLGRVSNLPTIWSNVLAGIFLSDASPSLATVIVLMLTMSIFYVGGMFLNDAFDREHDRRLQPDRPIPSGAIGGAEVFLAGYGMMAAALVLLMLQGHQGQVVGNPHAVASGAALAVAIVAYNRWHKTNPGSPLLMALCRSLVYVTCGLAAGGIVSGALVFGASILFFYVMALTLVSKYIGRGVRWLIAGISLVDALLLTAFGHYAFALAAAIGFPMTALFQRRIRGT